MGMSLDRLFPTGLLEVVRGNRRQGRIHECHLADEG